MGSEVLALTLALTMSSLCRPPAAQDPMRVRAERTGRSKRGALARRLHGNQGAGPFLRKLCLRDRPLWKRRGCHFSKPEKKIVKAQNGIFFFSSSRRRRRGQYLALDGLMAQPFFISEPLEIREDAFLPPHVLLTWGVRGRGESCEEMRFWSETSRGVKGRRGPHVEVSSVSSV